MSLPQHARMDASHQPKEALMRRKEIGDGLMQDDETYRKVRPADKDQKAPRENPSAQGPGKQGHKYADYVNWTHEELLELANTLEVPDAEHLTREALIENLAARRLP